MTSPSRTYKVRFTGDSSDLGRAARTADDDLTKVQNTIGNLNKVAMAASAAVLVGIGAFVAQGAASLVNMERINAQQTQAIKSTNAAWAKQDELEAYSEKIEKLTGIEHENVQEGQNLLLTFTNIQNSAGAGNDIFTQATDILVDMSVAMGTDVKTSAIQLGKALNDPIKGITALTKVGVTFNDQQREQIKTMTEAGDVAGAQKVILAELNKEFGGSAAAFGETTAGQLAMLKNSFGDVQEELATAFLPVLTNVFDKLSGFANWAKENPDLFQGIVFTVGGLATAVLTVNTAIDAYKVAVGLATAAQWAWNAAMLANPVGVVILAIAAIIVGIGLIMAGFGFDWKEFWEKKIKEPVQRVWDDITGKSDQATSFITGIPDRIGEAFSSLGARIANPFIGAFNKIAGAWNATVGRLGGVELPAVLGGGRIGLPTLGFASYLAKGGPAQAGMPYVVGEVGPELFVPSTNGTVVPNSALTGDVYVAVQVGNEPIAAVARAERIEAGKETRRWVRATNASMVGAAA
jgi:hypothetical protein